MSRFTRILHAVLTPETRDSGVSVGVEWGAAMMGIGRGSVSPVVAEQLSTITACVNAISDGLASLPARVYRESTDTGRVEVPNHPVAKLIAAPNRHQTWPDFMSWLVAQILLHGNGLAVIVSDGAGNPTALTPIPWPRVNAMLLPTGALVYDIVQATQPGQVVRYLETEVLHVKDRSDDGLVGRSRLSRAPDVLAAALGLQEYSSSIWENSATPSGMVTPAVGIKPDGLKRMSESFNQKYVGARNAKKVVFADPGSTFTAIQTSPEDAEVLASRAWTTSELCRLMGVPPPLVQDYSNNTFTNSASASLWFSQFSLSPIARKIEAEFKRSVFADPNGPYCLDIDMAGLQRGDYATRWTANVAAVTANILTADEIREQEGYGPKPVAPAAAQTAEPGAKPTSGTSDV